MASIKIVCHLHNFTEMKEEHVFKKYSPGEPSVRLYLKNLAKQVEDKVIHHYVLVLDG